MCPALVKDSQETLIQTSVVPALYSSLLCSALSLPPSPALLGLQLTVLQLGICPKAENEANVGSHFPSLRGHNLVLSVGGYLKIVASFCLV